MKRILKWLAVAGVILVALVAIAIWQRFQIIVMLPPTEHALLEPVDEGEGAEWFDDYYVIEEIAPGTYAIVEPRYWQRNANYLVIGSERALLIDAGPGVRDINPVVQSLTDLPYTLALTHFHFDHTGNGHEFERIAIPDLPYLRSRAKDGVIQIRPTEHLGSTEGFEAPAIRVDEWLTPGDMVDLGDRQIQVRYTPGHTIDSVSFYDAENGIVFSGDWFTEAIGVFLPFSSMGDNLLALESAICALPDDVRYFPAHKYEDGNGAPLPLHQTDILDAITATLAFKDGTLEGSGIWPRAYPMSERLTLYTDIPWLVSWREHYPELTRLGCKEKPSN